MPGPRVTAASIITIDGPSGSGKGTISRLVADRLGLPRPPRLPRDELKTAVSPAMYSFMSESRRLRNVRIKRELRVRLRYPTVADALAHLPAEPAAPTVSA